MIPGSQQQMLERYVNAVLAAPASLGLTAAPDAAEFWERHVLDALKILTLIPNSLHTASCKVIDVGSGNGIPGIPVSIALPAWHVTLLDSNNKKSGFLDMFCKFNKLDNVHVLTDRAEALGQNPKFRGQFDIAFARALGKLPSALELTIPFLKNEGLLVIPHGNSYQVELARSQKAMKALNVVHQASVPYTLTKDISFMALMFSKIADTPERYPRKSGIPSKRPL